MWFSLVDKTFDFSVVTTASTNTDEDDDDIDEDVDDEDVDDEDDDSVCNDKPFFEQDCFAAATN